MKLKHSVLLSIFQMIIIIDLLLQYYNTEAGELDWLPGENL